MIGEKISKLRKLLKISQKDFAKMLQVTPSAVSQWENNKTSPDIDLLPKIAKVLNTSVSDLMGETPSGRKEQANDDLWDLRESLRRDPQRRMLFDAARDVRREDIETAVRILEALKGGSSSDTD